jgi:hypothetical protein
MGLYSATFRLVVKGLNRLRYCVLPRINRGIVILFNLNVFIQVAVHCQVVHHKSKSVPLRPTLSRPVHLGVRRPSGTSDQYYFLLEIFFRQLRVCYFVAPSLTGGRVCNLLLLLVLASAVPLGPALSDERSGLSFVSMYIRHLHKIFTLSVFDTVQGCIYTIYTRPLSVQARYSRLCPSY